RERITGPEGIDYLGRKSGVGRFHGARPHGAARPAPLYDHRVSEPGQRLQWGFAWRRQQSRLFLVREQTIGRQFVDEGGVAIQPYVLHQMGGAQIERDHRSGGPGDAARFPYRAPRRLTVEGVRRAMEPSRLAKQGQLWRAEAQSLVGSSV